MGTAGDLPEDALLGQLKEWATKGMGYMGQLPDPDQVPYLSSLRYVYISECPIVRFTTVKFSIFSHKSLGLDTGFSDVTDLPYP
jgi:hypothetical protein